MPTDKLLDRVEGLGEQMLYEAIPGLQVVAEPGERHGNARPLSDLGKLAILERVELITTRRLRELTGDKRARFAFTLAAPVRPYAYSLGSDPAVPLEYRDNDQSTPHTDSGFIGPAVHDQFELPAGCEYQEREVFLALTRPGRHVGWNPSLDQLSPAARTWQLAESLKRQLHYRQPGMEDPAVTPHLEGTIHRGITGPGVLTIFMDGNMAPKGQPPLRQAAHLFRSFGDDAGASSWVRYSMLASHRDKSPRELEQLREQFRHQYLVAVNRARGMELREALKRPADPSPYRFAHRTMIDIQESPDMAASLQRFEEVYGSDLAVKMARYLLGPGHELINSKARGSQVKGKAPVYLAWPGDLQGLPEHELPYPQLAVQGVCRTIKRCATALRG